MWPDSARDDAREGFLRALVCFGAALFLITESLSLFHGIGRFELIACWSMAAVPGLIRLRPRIGRLPTDPVVLLCAAGSLVVLALTFVTAGCSPPNSADAMAYHMPRVVYWTEHGGIQFFPTPYFNQIMLQPLAEYLMLHTFVLSGGDRFVNFVQWFASVASVIGVSAVARMLGATPRGQAIAALFCATLPSGILAGSGAKNDYFLAMWLVAAVYFALRFDGLFLGLALGLALLTKATAYMYAPWILAGILIGSGAAIRKRAVPGICLALAAALLLNAPHYARNLQLSGSVLGFDSAQGDGVYRWRNQTFGWKQTASNGLRSVSEQLGARSERWNQGVYRAVLRAHRLLGIAIDDPDTTWPGSTFAPPVNANHEANAPNRWHLAILIAIAAYLFWQAARGRERRLAWYAVALFCAFLSFCAYLKWQPFEARLLLPLFVLGSPLASPLGAASRRAALLQIGLALFLLNNARPAVFQNWVRPLQGPHSVLRSARDEQYFADMTQWNNAESYRQAVQVLARSGCNTVGIDITNLQLEYPLQALLRELNPLVRFLHTGVRNVSTRYPQPVAAAPCAIACLDCAGDSSRLKLYLDFPNPVLVGKFALLFPGTPDP